jgi:RND family efflux transporter MFP subunit
MKKLLSNRKFLIVAISMLLIAIVTTVLILNKKDGSGVTYKTAQVAKETLIVSVSGTGNVVVDKSENVNPSISGQVYDLSVNYGDQVKKGQTLFKIKNDELDISVNQAYASYLQAKQTVNSNEYKVTQAKNNQTTIEENENSTDEQKADAAQNVVEAEAALELSKIQSTNAYSSYKLKKVDADLRTVTAPIDGTITTLSIKNGDQLGSSGNSSSSNSSSSSSTTSSVPIVIADLNTLKAEVSINEVDATLVKADQKASLTFDAIDDFTLTGKVERMNTIGTENSGVVTYPATITFDSLDERVKPQMSLTAAITLEVKQDVLTIANAAVKTATDGSSYVLVMENDSPVQKTVEIGSSNDTSTEITNGLNEGDTVVTQTLTNSDSNAESKSSSSSNNLNLRGLTGGGTIPGGGIQGGPPSN